MCFSWCEYRCADTLATHIVVLRFFRIGFVARTVQQNIQVMPDDHSELEPPLPIPNRTVKRLHADDSADTRVKVGNRQAPLKNPLLHSSKGFLLYIRDLCNQCLEIRSKKPIDVMAHDARVR